EIICPAVDHAMADTDEPHLPAVPAQERGEVLDGSCVSKFDAFIPALFLDDRTVAGFGGGMGGGVEPFNLAPKRQIQYTVVSGKDREFNAGRAGVEDKDRRNHLSSGEGQDSEFLNAFSRSPGSSSVISKSSTSPPISASVSTSVRLSRRVTD